MASETSPRPKWIANPPSQFDIVACYFPETKPKAELKLRPCLVENVYQSKKTGLYAVDVAFGTKNLKTSARNGLDVIIHNSLIWMKWDWLYRRDLTLILATTLDFLGTNKGSDAGLVMLAQSLDTSWKSISATTHSVN